MTWAVLALSRTATAQDERRVPPPRVEPGLMLQRDANSDGGPRLESIGGDRLLYREPRFTATIAADGSVEFRDVVIKPQARLLGLDLFKGKLDPPKPIARDNFEERALYPQGPPTAATFISVGGGFGGIGGIGGIMAALVSKLRRKAGGLGTDNGRTNLAAKARFLADTEALRMRMAHAWLKQRLAEQQAALVEQALVIWRDSSRSLAERRRLLFVLWDECADPAEARSPADEIRAEAAREARGRIEALIRRLAPQGSDWRFTAAELAQFNAKRQSRARFDPYASGAP